MDDLGAGILVLALAGEGDGEHLAMGTRLHEPHSRILHGETRSQVPSTHSIVAFRRRRPAWSPG